MSKLFTMSNEEKNRILNLHENAIKKEHSLTKNDDNLLIENTLKDKVISVQQALVNLGYDLGEYGSKGDGVDGDFGPTTRAAVIKYQQNKGIYPAKGNVGPKTAAALGVEPLTSASSNTSASASSGDSSGLAVEDSPFNNSSEGNAFRKWMHDNFPNDVKNLDLDLVGSHTNNTIKNAFNSKPKGWTSTTYGQYYLKTKGKTQPSQTSGKDSISSNIDPKFTKKFNLSALDSTKSKPIFMADQPDCAQFVNDWYTKKDYVGNAWNAHDFNGAGTRVKTGYHGLTDSQINTVNSIFQAIVKKGGPEATTKGNIVNNIKSLNQQLVPKINASDLKKDDIVGIYYPPSSHHEEAFFQAALSGYEPNELPKGKGYFIKDGKGGWKPGQTISKGTAFGMNTHLGIVGAIKNGVPIIFHNIGSQVFADPYNKLFGGGKIMWIKRS